MSFLTQHLVGVLLLVQALAPPSLSGQEPASAASEGYVEAGRGVRLYFRISGAGPDTVVIVHGGPGFSMEYLAADLAPLARHHALLFYDQRGAGRSTLVSDSSDLTGERFADDLEAVRRHFHLTRMTVLGHSWGAGVLGLYAERYAASLGRVIIVDGIGISRGRFLEAFGAMQQRRASATRTALDSLHAARVADPHDAGLCRAYYAIWFRLYFADTSAMHRSRGDFCGDSPESRANKVKAVDRYLIRSLGDWDWQPAMAQVTGPVLVIHGAEDPIPESSDEAWAAAAPNGRLLVIADAGHFPYLERPQDFFPAIEAFLGGRWPPGAAHVAAH